MGFLKQFFKERFIHGFTSHIVWAAIGLLKITSLVVSECGQILKIPSHSALQNCTRGVKTQPCSFPGKQCKYPETPKNGRVVVLTNLLFKSVVSHTCEEGWVPRCLCWLHFWARCWATYSKGSEPTPLLRPSSHSKPEFVFWCQLCHSCLLRKGRSLSHFSLPVPNRLLCNLRFQSAFSDGHPAGAESANKHGLQGGSSGLEITWVWVLI